jgi:hypothetical protein
MAAAQPERLLAQPADSTCEQAPGRAEISSGSIRSMTDAATFDEVTELPRAGFWRRLASITLDLIIVMLPFQMLAAVLFAATAGTVQMQNGFFSFCEHGGKDQISEQLRPLAPRDSNFITNCRTSFLGATTARRLIVGRATRDGNITTNVTNSFMQDQEGAVIMRLPSGSGMA